MYRQHIVSAFPLHPLQKEQKEVFGDDKKTTKQNCRKQVCLARHGHIRAGGMHRLWSVFTTTVDSACAARLVDTHDGSAQQRQCTDKDLQPDGFVLIPRTRTDGQRHHNRRTDRTGAVSLHTVLLFPVPRLPKQACGGQRVLRIHGSWHGRGVLPQDSFSCACDVDCDVHKHHGRKHTHVRGIGARHASALLVFGGILHLHRRFYAAD